MQFVSSHPVLSFGWLGLLIAVIYTTFKGATSKVKDIGNTELTRLINSEEAVVVDTRTIDDFRKGHIVGAINLTPTDIKNGTLAVLTSIKSARLSFCALTAQLPRHRRKRWSKKASLRFIRSKTACPDGRVKTCLWFGANSALTHFVSRFGVARKAAQ